MEGKKQQQPPGETVWTCPTNALLHRLGFTSNGFLLWPLLLPFNSLGLYKHPAATANLSLGVMTAEGRNRHVSLELYQIQNKEDAEGQWADR